MTYPGNPSLPPDVQQRIRSTFDHTLGLAESGSRQEALLGCDFVLRMDPLFEPARRLQERLDAASGAVAVDDLRRPGGGGGGRPAPASPAGGLPGDEMLWADLEGLSPELPELPPLQSPLALRAELETMLGERRFQELLERATQESSQVAGDLELQHIVSVAHERLEAGPYVSRFLASARDALRAGNAAEGGRLIEKARSLDPTHPGIAVTENPTLAAQATTASPAPRSPNSPTWKMPTIPGGLEEGAAQSRTQRIAMPPAASTAPPGSAATADDAAGFATGIPPSGSLYGDPAFGTDRGDGATTFGDGGATFGDGGDSESERRIQQLLDEGQKALGGGDPQAAIDAWSRIFLIDIDHQEAARRIEAARRLKAERDRKVEESFHDGLGHLEARDSGAAADAFRQVLELQPGNLQAREYLQQLEQGQMPALSALHSGAATSPTSPIGAAYRPGATSTWAGGAAPGAALPDDLMLAAGAAPLAADHDLMEEILVPPDLSQAEVRAAEPRREARSASSASHEGRARRLFMLVGSAVLLLVLAVGWFLYQKREQWFPNSRTEEPAQPAAPNPIPRATKLHDAGKVTIALNQLRRVPPADPHFKEAQALIAKWQAEQSSGVAPGAPGNPGNPGVNAADATGTGALGVGTTDLTGNPLNPANPLNPSGSAGQAATGPGGLPAAGAPRVPGAPGTSGTPGGPANPVNPGAPGSPGITASNGAGGGTGTPAERWQSLADEARKAYRGGNYVLAADRYEAANHLIKLTGTDLAQLADAHQRLAPLQRQIDMFHSHDWQYALPALWKAHEADPANKDAVRLIVDCYYDLGVRDLQHDDPTHAAQKFGEAKNLLPDDAGVTRQLLFAQTYKDRNPDLLYHIYVKYLAVR